ncbi:hypothetical protein GALMADRAFT_225829 [Galerina marginata CBS 339.88]|uniref:G-protein coupled receptors family 2 profile 2 domain-containing protein n=1 Tax=Galerina marginata (strain CBS 339.88) TaxID=685588 RepID=A0A067T1E1_GALM3|nr:hypothetical protein GALMADRAFT_225829 [Galerina marginata CBS 339.88]
MLIASITNVLLLGRQTGPQPNVGLCLFQAMLIYAFPVLCAFSAASFTLQVYLSIHLALKSDSKLSKASQTWLLVVPCAFFFAVLLEVFIVGLLDIAEVKRDPMGVNCKILRSTP